MNFCSNTTTTTTCKHVRVHVCIRTYTYMRIFIAQEAHTSAKFSCISKTNILPNANLEENFPHLAAYFLQAFSIEDRFPIYLEKEKSCVE